MKTVKGYLIDIFAFEQALPLPPVAGAAPARGAHPCGVRTCLETQVIVHQDERETVVECPVHECHTRWDTIAIEAREQNIIRVQHGTRPPPKR